MSELKSVDSLRAKILSSGEKRDARLGNDSTSFYYSVDTLLLAELLLQLIGHFDRAVDLWINQQYTLARTQAVTITTGGKLIYNNPHPHPIPLELFNIDPSQTIYIGHHDVTILSGIPVFPEDTRRVTIEPGDNLYGIVEHGTADIRFLVLVTWRGIPR